MSKSWSLFSILVVFALLILLAPVAILAPPQNVVQAGTTYNLAVNVTPSGGGDVTVNGTTPPGYPNTTTWNAGENVTLSATAANSDYAFVNWSGNLTGSTNPTNITMNSNKSVTANFNFTPGVVQEVEASFNFSEDAGGGWETFKAGNATIQGAGLTLEQYTRPYVLLSSSLAGCGFRNYTTGSGTVTGGLSGSLSLAWITFRFNQQYSGPGDLYYSGATDFGWMAGRGHIGENLTFVFVADLDCDNDMTNAEGKGSMVSTEESGDSAGHKVIGDFEVVKSDKNYTWSLHLRDYAPNEVCYRGNVTVSGGVMQENTDPIHNGLDLVNFTQDGAEATPTDFATGFEEICWGKDPQKNITGGPLGKNGTMDITRNGALYLSLPGGWAHIQAAEVCILHINDTNEGPRLDDGSPYGHAYYYLALTLPYQELEFGDYFNQTGYTWGPFGMHLQSTDCYTGMETFANAQIGIESSPTDSLQTSVDESYGLYPHPKVGKIFPKNGFPGTTMDVKIYGKYFLRAYGVNSGGDPNSGSVSFGPNITVNSYTVDSAEQITANINISPGSASTEVVNVTSCFGYQDGNGTEPYKSGLGTFDIVTETATLEGQLDFSTTRGAPGSRWNETFDVKAFEPGNLNFQVWSGTGTTNESGVFTMPGLLPETYDIAIKNRTCVSNLVHNVTLNSTGQADFNTTVEGDVVANDKVDGYDTSAISTAYNTMPWDGYWNVYADLNRDGKVDGYDSSAASTNYNVMGDAVPHFL